MWVNLCAEALQTPTAISPLTKCKLQLLTTKLILFIAICYFLMNMFNELNGCKKAYYKFKIPVKTCKRLFVWVKAFKLQCNLLNNNLSMIIAMPYIYIRYAIVLWMVQNEPRKVLPLDFCERYFKQAFKKFYSIQIKTLVKFSSKGNWCSTTCTTFSRIGNSISEKKRVQNILLMSIFFTREKTFLFNVILITCLT